MIIIFVFATRQKMQLILSNIYAFLCLYFDSMLILCHFFVELEHFTLFNNFDKYYSFIYYRINIKLKVLGKSVGGQNAKVLSYEVKR